MDRLEYTTPNDAFYDYCLWPYTPLAPLETKLRSVNLLFHSFDLARIDARAFGLVEALWANIGMFHTVWGIKHLAGRLHWEFYFYDYRRRNRERSMTRVLGAVKPFIRCEIRANENLPYFMFSIDIGEDLLSGAKNLEGIHLYIGNPGSTVSSGISYLITRDGSKLENFYFFFDAQKQREEILDKVFCSAHIDSEGIGIDEILWPEMTDCRVIVVANKQTHDSVYFSRIRIGQLIFFLRRLRYPQPLIAFMEENRSRLDHLLYDVGYDYRMEGRELRILKSGYYGIF